jgi:hypothetical protein
LAIGDCYNKVMRSYSVITATTLYRKSIVALYEQSIYAKQNWPFGDNQMILFASLHGTFIYIPVSTAVWRYVSGSATNSGYRSLYSIYEKALECRELFVSQTGRVPPDWEEIRTEAIRSLYRLAYLAGMKTEFELHAAWLKSRGIAPGGGRHWVRRLVVALALPLVLVRRKAQRLSAPSSERGYILLN